MCTEDRMQEKKSCSSTRNISFHITVHEGSPNFNEKKNLNQILLQHKTEAEKLILSHTRAPKQVFCPQSNPAAGTKKNQQSKIHKDRITALKGSTKSGLGDLTALEEYFDKQTSDGYF